ncbi:MAG: DUF4160 domain-containing protein [Paludibacteraceae bacterium]
MPKIFEYLGFIFYFFSNEHDPIHVHVTKGGCETIFELIIENSVLIEIRQRKKRGVEPLSQKDSDIAKDFIEAYSEDIVNKWIDFFVLKKPVHSTTINKKV